MMRTIVTIVLLVLGATLSRAQDVPLFKSRDPLNIRATGSIKSIKKNSNDSTFVAGKFEFEEKGAWTVVKVESRVRGNYRLRNCFFPPLKVRFKKKDVQSTVFEGNKSLKVVLPCQTSSDRNALVRKEYLCYRMYELISPYHFRTRLANLQLTEVTRKKPRTYDLTTFFVEDNSMVAKRTGAKVIKKKGIHPSVFDEAQSVRNDYFQFMIGNADWSVVYQHNSNTLYAGTKFIPLSYDFDMSGFVDAPYAHIDAPTLGTGDPRDRVYRGFCKSPDVMQQIREEFLAREKEVHLVIDSEASFFAEYELRTMHDYISGFYDILRNEAAFQTSIVEQCRKDQGENK
jgi:hypothetical protein